MSFFLLGTVFYQGSMFSSLIALTPPDLPSTLESVVDSKIQIITTSFLAISMSLLRYEIIDEVMNATGKSTKLFHTLTDLKARTSFIPPSTSSSFGIALHISEARNLKFENNVFKKVMDTFAIINTEYDLDQLLAGMGVKRSPFVVRHTESPRFFINKPVTTTRGFASCVLYESIGQLVQSGLFKLWMDLQNTKNFAQGVAGGISKEQYRRIVANRIFGAKKQIIFEEAEQVELSSLENIVVLFAGIIGISIAAFMREWLTYQILSHLGWKCWRIACQVLTMMKLLLIKFQEGADILSISLVQKGCKLLRRAKWP
ncbi:hypothetical protein Fcan01_26539 [Folsomia candida]|uniref:Uncharacterized protein n=1 Tax=Folsomia candida TaxID=158441 RepID=A0A226D0B2_FOLCA|nr:hypothetical protein Fcan01_26539 [Folsomia candida]